MMGSADDDIVHVMCGTVVGFAGVGGGRWADCGMGA